LSSLSGQKVVLSSADLNISSQLFRATWVYCFDMKIQQLLTIQTLITVCFLLLSDKVIAQRERPNPAELIKKLDKNQDGAVSKDEVPVSGWERLSKLDKNSDGKITKEEVTAIRPGTMEEKGPNSGKAPTADQRGQLFQRMDKNEDGKLAKSEVPEQFWEKLSRADQNKDDFVSKEEMEAANQYMQSRQRGGKGGPSGAAGVMTSFDENDDGKLAQSEVSAGMWAKISKLDSDKDGSVSRAELGKAYE